MNYSKAADKILAHISKPGNTFIFYTALWLKNDLFPFRSVRQIEDVIAWMSNQDEAESIADFSSHTISCNGETLSFIKKGGFQQKQFKKEGLPKNSSLYTKILSATRKEIALLKRKELAGIAINVLIVACLLATVYLLLKML